MLFSLIFSALACISDYILCYVARINDLMAQPSESTDVFYIMNASFLTCQQHTQNTGADLEPFLIGLPSSPHIPHSMTNTSQWTTTISAFRIKVQFHPSLPLSYSLLHVFSSLIGFMHVWTAGLDETHMWRDYAQLVLFHTWVSLIKPKWLTKYWTVTFAVSFSFSIQGGLKEDQPDRGPSNWQSLNLLSQVDTTQWNRCLPSNVWRTHLGPLIIAL